MSHHSFRADYVLLTLLLIVVYLVLGGILERRSSILYPMVELCIALLIGLIYSVVAACIFTTWAYPVRVLAGLAAGIVVGWALMMTLQLLKRFPIGAIAA
jgi:hypothetical protein